MLLANEYNPDVRVEKEANALTAEGYSVGILAWDRAHRHHDSKSSDLDLEHLRVLRIQGKFAFVLTLPLFSFKLLRKGLALKPDLVHAHDLDTLLIGVLVSRILRVPLVYDAHEHYARMVAQDLPEWICGWLDRLEARLVPKADLVIAANDRILDYLKPHIEGDSTVVMNCIDLPIISKERQEDEGQATIFYGGSLEPLRFIEEAISLSARDKRFILRVAGRGSLQSLVESAASTNERVRYLGYLRHDRLLEEMEKADAVIALLNPSNENNRIGTPNRLFEAMAVGTAVLASKGTLSGQIVEEETCGLAIEWSEKGLAEALTVLSDSQKSRRMGQNGRKAAEMRYNWGIMRSRLIDHYARVLEREGGQSEMPIGAHNSE